MIPQVTIQIEIGEAQNDDGYTMVGVIAEEAEVVDQDDYVEPAVVEHVRREYGVEIDQ